MQAPAAYEHSQRLINGLRRSMNKALTVASQVAPRFLNKLSKTVGVSIALATFAVSAQAPLDVRVALIIGNSAYIGAPSLANPANDARAMGEVLRSLGFQVIELRDGNKAQMTAAISRVQESLKGKQAVAMLYYAGHGLQLDWRNYMVPVDARLASAADVPRQTIDLGSVIDTFKGAGTRMNIMVLDACRDNPFASSTSSAKGLAQLDAPPGTFLAYATAPGNVAEDGDEKGGNGMYTQYLLLELRKPFGKIEDVFKRVRLSVRQKTQGRQIPWESTSLEEDFFFNDGTRLATKPEELERLAAAAKRNEQQLLQQASQARERERQIALDLEKEREAQAVAARAAEEQRRLDIAKREEVERLAKDARVREQARLDAEIKAREEERLAQEAKARDRERLLAQERSKESERQKELALALSQARELEARRQQDLMQAEADRKRREEQTRMSKEEQRDQAFAIERAAWDKIKDSKNADDFYAFLRKYPNGLISQPATAALERLAKPAIFSQADKNGFKQGNEPRYRVGDRTAYVTRDGLTGIEKGRSTRVITKIENGFVEFNDGRTILTVDGGVVRNRYIENMDPPRLDFPPGEFLVGAKWSSRSIQTMIDGSKVTRDEEVKIVAFEEVTVPAGTFKAFRFELQGSISNGERVRLTYWALPDWGSPIRTIREIRPRYGTVEREVTELVARKRGDG
jgi:uncharacterized caspase-like protein